MRCECGGSLESLGGMHALSGIHPYPPYRENLTHNSIYYEGSYFYADKNKKGEFFVLDNYAKSGAYWHKINNPIEAIRIDNPITINGK